MDHESAEIEVTDDMLRAGGTLLAELRADLWHDIIDSSEAARQVFLAMWRERSGP